LVALQVDLAPILPADQSPHHKAPMGRSGMACPDPKRWHDAKRQHRKPTRHPDNPTGGAFEKEPQWLST